jgi:RNA recognition motif-containing protein
MPAVAPEAEETKAAEAASTEGGAASAPSVAAVEDPPGDSSEDVTPPSATTEETTPQPPSDESQSRRVYVGNLAWDVSWQDLKDLMKTTGHEVTRSDVMKSYDGRSKGCGIVEFATSEGAKQAVLTLNDKELNGRQIFVREDREGRPSTTGGGGNTRNSGSVGGGGHRFSVGEKAQSRRVYVGNLSWDVNWPILKDHMKQAGEVVHAEVVSEHSGRSKGCGIVEYSTEDEAQVAISTLTHSELNGRTIFVREDRETSSGGGGAPSSSSPRASVRSTQNSSVYVWNLSYETSWQDLKDHMRKAGNVDQATILTSSEGTSAGSGVVVFQKPNEAARAIRELQDSELNGRPIKLREDHGAQPRGRAGGGRGGFARKGHRPSCPPRAQLFVGNLSYDTNWRDLKDHFKQCGEVDRCDVKKGFGTVSFKSSEDAQRAIEQLNGVELEGRALEVRIDGKV